MLTGTVACSVMTLQDARRGGATQGLQCIACGTDWPFPICQMPCVPTQTPYCSACGPLLAAGLRSWFPDADRTAITAAINRLSGEVPSTFADNVALRQLDLSQNVLSGSIPAFAPSALVQVLRLSSNLFTGRLSNATLSLTQLRELTLDRNHLSCDIPTETADGANSSAMLPAIRGKVRPLTLALAPSHPHPRTPRPRP